jgi:maleate isomerase
LIEWSRKLGFVIPSWNTVIEYEILRMLPPGVSGHFSRVTHTDDSEASLEHMGEQLPSHAELLGHAKVDAICYACTAASFLHGRQHEIDYLSRVQTSVAPPIISMAGAIVDAAQYLGLKRVAVGAPYEQWLLDRLVRYLEGAGFQVVRAVGLGEQADVKHAPEKATELGLHAWSDEADGLILSCSNFRTLEMIPQLERRMKKPVLTSNNAALWKMLSVTGWRGVIPEAGVLFDGAAPGAELPVRAAGAA